jgi:O-acetylserine/cysteine efflux transporter
MVLLVVLIWGANNSLVKWGITGLDLFVFNGIRYLVALAVLALLFAARFRWVPVERTEWPRLLGFGLVASVAYQLAYIVGLSYTTAGNSSVLMATAPVWTILLSGWLHRERVTAQAWSGMAISFLGVLLIIFGSGKELSLGGTGILGDVISLGAAMLWALNANLQKFLLARYSPMQLSLVSTAVGAVGLGLAAVPSAAALDWSGIAPGYVVAAVLSGGLSIAAANVFYSFGVKKLGPARIAPFSNLVPALSVVVAYLTLGERFYPLQVAGATITIFGVWLARR